MQALFWCKIDLGLLLDRSSIDEMTVELERSPGLDVMHLGWPAD
jgi:hypothetical protein